MKRGPYHLLDHHHIVRTHSTICVDTLEIIPYSQYCLVSWRVSTSSKNLLSEMLREDFHDLLMRVILYRNRVSKSMVEFRVNDSSGTLHINGLTKGTYYCELVVSNSQHEMITLYTSTTFECDRNDKQKNYYQWNDVKEKEVDENWFKTFSGYSTYE